MNSLSTELVTECKIKLLSRKAELLNRVNVARAEHFSRDKGGDEADQSMEVLAEHEFLATQARARKELLEIESALARIYNGTYGICEETEEPIEEQRLLTIPWTRLSIEGAEIKESLRRRYAE